MINALQVFNYEGNKKLRTIQEDGDTWFVARDIAKALDYPETSIKQVNNLTASVPSIWKGHKRIMTPGGEQETLCLSEQGLYFFLGRSDKPKALPFQMWLAGEVVPQIRKHGMYLSGKLLEIYRSDPEIFDKIVENYASSQKKIAELEKQIADSQSFITLAKVVLGLPGSMTVQEIANFLCQYGYGNKVGQNRLYKILREKKWLCSRKGRQWNRPTQRSLEQGLCSVEVRNGFRPVTLITPKGLQKITILFTEENYPLILQMEQE